MSFAEKRRSNRRAISRLAKVQLAGGSLSRDCVVTDISEGGVRLHVEGFEVPDEFVLLLSDGSSAARPRDCKIVWRLGFELGAEFLDVRGRRGKQSGVAPAEQPVAG